jgi:uncharacterized membrane protein (DUF485 family)
MLHEPASATEKDYGVVYKTRLGVIMFIAYGLFYAGFIAINLYDAKLTEKIVLLGLNLATVYGFGLIIVALILAVIYNHMCTSMEKKLKAEDTSSSSDTAEKKEVE